MAVWAFCVNKKWDPLCAVQCGVYQGYWVHGRVVVSVFISFLPLSSQDIGSLALQRKYISSMTWTCNVPVILFFIGYVDIL